MQQLIVQLKEFALDQGPEILIAIAILIVGWVVALLAALLVRKAFKRTEIDNKIAKSGKSRCINHDSIGRRPFFNLVAAGIKNSFFVVTHP